ncbi:hypothetical protein VSS37_09535 [Candidatus Thiothrix sp. Deng01]|uniref:Uncharacterized protein n=1 Tax=Candidatus Thiothrix phosphatis TaxID=3112415 RepID=A0ABU6CXT1_9GAMM|nr:hypothetical protein [Candidatus Thiothrix sp. Deng01]MEB4591218.1 hypothetical protein [Candidatus Thiothrix sp. Deng01]
MANPNVKDAQYADCFSVRDAQTMNTGLTDFAGFILGDQGRNANVSEEDKQFVRKCIGRLKLLANKLAYGVEDNS